MPKYLVPVLLAVLLVSCGSLESKYTQLKAGDSKSDVARVMGPAPYQFTHESVDAWRYAVVAGFGYCDYREFYIYRDTLIYMNEYNRASIAGCTAGLKDIDWGPVLSAAEEYDKTNPVPVDDSSQSNIVDKLKELKKMKESGDLTEEEYVRAKQSLLNE